MINGPIQNNRNELLSLRVTGYKQVSVLKISYFEKMRNSAVYSGWGLST